MMEDIWIEAEDFSDKGSVRPRFRWVGFMLDEARHFFGKETVKAYLDRMAELGYDTFHWHLTDDQGWRIDLPGMPELVRHGATRPSSPVTGSDDTSDSVPYGPFFYSADDIREVVAYAGARGIRIVPEIDLPGLVLSAERVRAFNPLSWVPAGCEGSVLGGECCTWTEVIHDRAELDYKVLGRLATFAEAMRDAGFSLAPCNKIL